MLGNLIIYNVYVQVQVHKYKYTYHVGAYMITTFYVFFIHSIIMFLIYIWDQFYLVVKSSCTMYILTNKKKNEKVTMHLC